MNSALTTIGLAKESAWGVAPSNPTFLMPVFNDVKVTPVFAQILDDALRGIPSKDFRSYQGVGHAEVSFGAPVYPDEIGHMLLWMLGAASNQAVGNYYGWKILPSITPPTYALYDNIGVAPSRYDGLLLSSLEFSINPAEDLLKFTAEAQGKNRVDATFVMPSDATRAAFIGWQLIAILDGVYWGRVTAGSIHMARDIVLAYEDGNKQMPTNGFVDRLEVTGSLTVNMQDANDIARYEDHNTHDLITIWSPTQTIEDTIATGDGTTTSFNTTLPHDTPVSVVVVRAGSAYGVADIDGSISGDGVSGTIDRTNGSLSVTFDVAPGNGMPIYVTYTNGDALMLRMPKADPADSAPEIDRSNPQVTIGYTIRGLHDVSIGGAIAAWLWNKVSSY